MTAAATAADFLKGSIIKAVQVSVMSQLHLKKISNIKLKERKIVEKRREIISKALKDVEKTVEKKRSQFAKSTNLAKIDEEIGKLEKVSSGYLNSFISVNPSW